MNIDYRQLAESHGWIVRNRVYTSGYWYVHEGNMVGGIGTYKTKEEAWKACCVHNKLLDMLKWM